MADTKKIVHINFTASFEDTGKMYDTNIEACAKKNDIYNEKVTYAPMAYVVGSKGFYAEVDDAIANAEVGKEVAVSVPCEKAAGVRNPKLIELHALRDFYKAEINPYPGMPVSLGNRNGTVLSVGAGRVKVDFNSPLAGHDLCFKVTVVDDTPSWRTRSSSPSPMCASSTSPGPSPNTGSSPSTAASSVSTASSSSRSGSLRRSPRPPSDHSH